MEWRKTVYGWALSLVPGEEIVACLQSFATRHQIRAGMISAIGAVGETELGFFIPATREYARRVFTGDHEIGALTGNFSELEGRPFPHCHLVLGGPDFAAHTGHLFRAIVSVACEVQIVTDPGVLTRIARPDLGFNPLALDSDGVAGPRPDIGGGRTE